MRGKVLGIEYWVLGLLTFAAIGCGDGGSGANVASNVTTSEKPLVVFSQANSRDPWRKVFDADTQAAAAQHAEHFQFEMQDAGGDANRQNDMVETFLVKGPKVLLISPTEVSVQKSIEKAFDQGVKVVLLDRAIESEKYTCWIGGDNIEIGRQAGEYIAKRLNGKGKVLMIRGIASATPTQERAKGAMESFAKYPGIKVVEGDDCGYERIKARSYMESFLQKGEPVDAVYAHNDEMAIGARLAYDAWFKTQTINGALRSPIFVGIDACQQEVVDMIKAGKLDATFKYPTPGAKGIEVAAALLQGKEPESRKIVLETVLVTKDTADQYLKDNPNLAK
jgi:ribose transport system substrate-binding protein